MAEELREKTFKILSWEPQNYSMLSLSQAVCPTRHTAVILFAKRLTFESSASTLAGRFSFRFFRPILDPRPGRCGLEPHRA